MTDINRLKVLAERAEALYGAPSLEHVFAITKFREAVEPKAILRLIAEIERLRSRLEIDECIPHDGISCRDETIKALDEKCDKLKAENEALLLGMRAILNAYDYADQYNKEGVAVEVMEDLRTLFKGATQ
ncbi:TPA: hypothetical protein SL675_003876 [Pseudomonas aeruginosa]|nr:hypothetical protein [Pseudomonas aeruginosa]HEJ2068490.1 hypothetical protein [Pseudomonas aeruginosa]HEJ4469265.1 hypothetical protein [Pseudomonas aeruginosa]HEJ5099249.1 hypothetical protein [Pseudomonas aeruginosa]HEJ5111199.1 hypothetical protein [Pseudomonas aeruginosa]